MSDQVYEIVMDHSGRIISRKSRHKTAEEITQERLRAEMEKARRERQLEEAEELRCDECATPIGFVYACDLNGSAFYCKSCWEEAHD